MRNFQSDWFIIVNPHAGSGKTMSEWKPAERLLLERGITYTVAQTTHKQHATTLAREACAEGCRRILAVGGDGSAHEVFKGVMDYCTSAGVSPSEFTIGVFPIGSGNDLIRSLGLPRDPSVILDRITSLSTVPLDVVRAGSDYMLNIGGTGFDSHVCEAVNAQKEAGKRSKLIYFAGLLRVIKKLKILRLKVIADGAEVFSGECYSIALGNGCYSGSGMRQVPDAVFDDGLIDYMIAPKIPLLTILGQLPKLFNGKLSQRRDLLVFGKCKSLRIEPLDTASADIYELDGEVEGNLPLTVEITGEQINVIA